jgi:hypothetical protein
VRLMIIFLGLYHDTFGEIPMILEEYGLITQQEMDELYEYEIYAPTVRPRAEITGGGGAGQLGVDFVALRAPGLPSILRGERHTGCQ